MNTKEWRSRASSLVVLALPALLWAGACSENPVEPDPGDLLRAQLELWRSQDISNYRYVYRAMCFCGPDARTPAEDLIFALP